jgi:hypothetical protein
MQTINRLSSTFHLQLYPIHPISHSNKMASRLGNFVKFYNTNFERRPIPTLMITNSTLNTIADILVSPPPSVRPSHKLNKRLKHQRYT